MISERRTAERSLKLAAPRWAALRLLHDPNLRAARRAEAPKQWTVEIHVKDDAGKSRYLYLLLTFRKAFPERHQWPNWTGR